MLLCHWQRREAAAEALLFSVQTWQVSWTASDRSSWKVWMRGWLDEGVEDRSIDSRSSARRERGRSGRVTVSLGTFCGCEFGRQGTGPIKVLSRDFLRKKSKGVVRSLLQEHARGVQRG